MAQPVYSADGTTVTYTIVSNVSYNSNVVGITNSVNSITIDNAGSNYNYPPQIRLKTKDGDTGFGAQAVATIYGNGTIANINVTNQGTGYSMPPDVEFYDLRTESLGAIIINNPGAGYGGGPAYVNIQPPTDPNYPTPPQTGHPEQAVANVVLVQNAVNQVIIGNTGKGYSIPPLVNVSPAQNNYPAVAAQLTAVLNSGTGAHATAQILPTYISQPVEGGSYYLRNSSVQNISANISMPFSGNIFIQGSLDGNSWFNIKKMEPVTGTIPIIGKYVFMRVKVEDFAAGTINNISLTYGYNG